MWFPFGLVRSLVACNNCGAWSSSCLHTLKYISVVFSLGFLATITCYVGLSMQRLWNCVYHKSVLTQWKSQSFQCQNTLPSYPITGIKRSFVLSQAGGKMERETSLYCTYLTSFLFHVCKLMRGPRDVFSYSAQTPTFLSWFQWFVYVLDHMVCAPGPIGIRSQWEIDMRE